MPKKQSDLKAEPESDALGQFTHSLLYPLKRIVIKIGSNLFLEKKSNHIKKAWLESIAKDVLSMRQKGIEVILVCSGAIRLGKSTLVGASVDTNLDDKQAAAAIGQVELISIFRDVFESYQMKVAQILLTVEDTEVRRRNLNARATFMALLRNGVIPIVNENDTVATTEIRSGDNDRLSARIAQVVSADHLFLLSSKIDGLYNQDPKENENAMIIPEIGGNATAVLSQFKSAYKGKQTGVTSKIEAATHATQSGCSVILSKALDAGSLGALVFGATKLKTIFKAAISPTQARQNWIAGHLLSSGSLVVSSAGQKMIEKGQGLLPKHVVSINGIFQRGELVSIMNQFGDEIGRGLSAYCWKDAVRIRGADGVSLLNQLGFGGRDEIIHMDDLISFTVQNIPTVHSPGAAV